MVTTIIAVIGLVIAVCAFLTAISMGAATPSDAMISTLIQHEVEQKTGSRMAKEWELKAHYDRGYYAGKMEVYMDVNTFKPKTPTEQEEFARILTKAIKPLEQLKKDLGIKI